MRINFCVFYIFRSPNSGSARTNPTPALTHRTVPSTPTTNTSTNQTTPSAGQTTPQNTAIPAVTPDAPSRPHTTPRPAEATPTTGSTNPIQLSDLQNFLQGIGPVPPEEGQRESGNTNNF